ncbi:MAG TPA: hypothetical protein VFJ22_06970, partial [Dermatophilaceae bacterium]|nr:hypothetical protein [Dermatophilaceae bacterium]
APHEKKVVSLLAGITRCSRCHAPMCSSGWGVRRVYRCNMSVGGCGRTTRNRALVDEWVIRELLGHFSDVVLVDERSAARAALRRAERAYTDVRWPMVDATTAHEEGRLDGRDFYPIYDRLRRQRESSARRLAEARTRVEIPSKSAAARQLWEGWTVQERRVWIRQRVVAVIIHPPGQGRHEIRPGDVVIEYTDPSTTTSEETAWAPSPAGESTGTVPKP